MTSRPPTRTLEGVAGGRTARTFGGGGGEIQ